MQSLIGVKRTSRFALHMSASDPKQTCADAIREPGQYQSKRDIHWVDFAVGSWSKPDYFAFNCALELQVEYRRSRSTDLFREEPTCHAFLYQRLSS